GPPLHLRGPGAGGGHGAVRAAGGGGGQGAAGADQAHALRGDPARGGGLVPPPRRGGAAGGPARAGAALRGGGARAGRAAEGLPPLRGRRRAPDEGEGRRRGRGGAAVIAAWALSLWASAAGAGPIDCSKVEPARSPDPAAAQAYLEVGDAESRQGRPDTAAVAFREAVRLDP